MENEQILIDRSELDNILYDEVLKWRHMFFDLCLEDYAPPLTIKRTKRKGKSLVVIDAEEWGKYDNWVGECLGDLMTARAIIEQIKPVFNEYREEYEKKHSFNFDNYIKSQVASYDADDFERVRDKFEDEYFKDLIEDEELER